MKWNKLSDGRTCLPAGTILQLEEAGGYYRITGGPIGFGGSGIIYPAVRVRKGADGWQDEEMNLAVKECFPCVPGMVLERDAAGRIAGEENRIYQFALEQMRREKTVTGTIYNAGFRLIPVWTSSEQEKIALDGEHFEAAHNYYAVMERIDEKGRSLEDLARNEQLTAREIMSLACQLLRALKEVHGSGFIHGDIQTNNIFVKGYEAGDDLGVVSLLDFGAARVLGPDNRTAPIEDRALYTTKGFTPPECLTGNDGTLQLTPAADLYSAGCVILRMLSGRAVSRQALELVTNGRYIYARQAAKLRCPDSAAAAINSFLDRALQKDPADRYPSAEEMLREASRIEQSLAPANIAISVSEYAAFISYCHSEKTKRAAQMLADAIEHYHIPDFAAPGRGKENRKRRRPGKVFLDRMELSGGGDMGDQIARALEQSAYLIVVLGGGSDRSEWVTREIETFLKTHTRDRVLTVLAEGDEKEGMPPILKTQEFFTEDGKKVLGIESLSADLRADTAGDLKKKLRTEKLRLLAPMLGCSFDDLRQREKEARTRRLVRSLSVGMAMFAVIAGIIGYQSIQIKNRNLQLLKIHSKELAERSGRALKEGDREQALSLALEALPSSSEDRSAPVTAEARAALQNALYLYRDMDNMTMAKKAFRTMKMGRKAAPGTEELSPDGLKFLTRGTDGSVFVWDLATGACLAGPDEEQTNELNEGALFAGFLDDETLLLIKKDKALHYTIAASSDGETDKPQASEQETAASEMRLSGWPLELESFALPIETPLLGTFNEDRSRIAFCALDPYGMTEDGVRQVNPELIVCDTGTMQELGRLSAADGSSGFEGFASLTASGPVFSHDGRWAALPLTDLFKADDPYSDKPAGALLLLDLEEGQSRVITDQESGFLCCCFAGENSLFACGYMPVTLWELTEMPLKGAAFNINIETGDVRWKTSTENQTKMGTDTLGILAQKDTVILWGNRQIQALDMGDGRLLSTMQVRDGIAGVAEGSGEGNWLFAGDRRGRLVNADVEEGVVSENVTSIDRPVDHFWYTRSLPHGAMIVSETKTGTYYLLGATENEAGERLSCGSRSGMYYVSVDSSYMLIEKEAGSGVLTALDLRSGKWAGTYPKEDAVIRFCGAEQIFSLKESEDGRQTLKLIDLSADEILMEKEFEADVQMLFYGGCCGWQEGTLFHLLNGREEIELALPADTVEIPDSGQEKKETNEIITGMNIDDKKHFLYLYGTEEGDLLPEEHLRFLYDLTQGKWLPLPPWTDAGKEKGTLTISSDGAAAAWLDKEDSLLRVFFAGSEEAKVDITLPSAQNCHVDFGRGNKVLYVIANDGILRSYDTFTGEQLSQSKEIYTHASLLMVSQERNLILLDATAAENDRQLGASSNYGLDTMRVLWIYEETPEHELCRMAGADSGVYSAAADRVVGVDTAGGQIYLYDYYGPEKIDELISKARELLPGA